MCNFGVLEEGGSWKSAPIKKGYQRELKVFNEWKSTQTLTPTAQKMASPGEALICVALRNSDEPKLGWCHQIQVNRKETQQLRLQ